MGTMSIKSMFENYYDNRAEIILISHDLKIMEEDSFPSCTSNLQLEPKFSPTTESPTEQTAINNLENENIKKLKKRRALLMCEVITVEQLLELLNEAQIKIWKMRTSDKSSWAKIADVMELDVRTVKNTYEMAFTWLEKIHQRSI